MRFSCKCTHSLCVGVLNLEPPAEATVGISEWFIAPGMSRIQQVLFLRELSLPHCATVLLAWAFGPWDFPARQQQLAAMGAVG